MNGVSPEGLNAFNQTFTDLNDVLRPTASDASIECFTSDDFDHTLIDLTHIQSLVLVSLLRSNIDTLDDREDRPRNCKLQHHYGYFALITNNA